MPEICHFYGIIITMYLPDHNPPHFHVRYNEYRATIDIQTGKVTGQMPRRALHLVFEWLDLHKEELMMNWIRMENGETLVKILHLTFNDGCQRIFDCLPLIEKYELFAPLRDKDVFARFDLDGWTVCWLNGTLDIAPEHLYENGVAA